MIYVDALYSYKWWDFAFQWKEMLKIIRTHSLNALNHGFMENSLTKAFLRSKHHDEILHYIIIDNFNTQKLYIDLFCIKSLVNGVRDQIQPKMKPENDNARTYWSVWSVFVYVCLCLHFQIVALLFSISNKDFLVHSIFFVLFFKFVVLKLYY